MSDILTNAQRYNTGNTFRSDGAGNNRGNQRNADGNRIGFDCSGYAYHVLRESGYDVPYAQTSAVFDGPDNLKADWATNLNPKTQTIPPGTLAYFEGHVGIVQSFDPGTGRGTFISMTGSDNSGKLKSDETFSIKKEGADGVFWGGTTPGGSREFLGFAAVKPDRYDRDLDQHTNGLNPDKPVFNIPEATNAGFITLNDNGGFPFRPKATDLSNNPKILAGNDGVAPPPPVDTPSADTPFARMLADLESKGQPNDGYGAWLRDGAGIGAIGRYGFREPSLQAIGWRDKNGNWTDEAKANGVASVEDFRNTPAAQETARVEYLSVLKRELKDNGVWGLVGDTVDGIPMTEGGLLAAAWKQGSGAVYRFIAGESTNNQADANVVSRLTRFADVAPTSANSPAPTNSHSSSATRTTSATDGSATYSNVAPADAPNGSFHKGDVVSFTYDQEGYRTSYVIWHKSTDGSYEIATFDRQANTETHTILDKAGTQQSSFTLNRDTGEYDITRREGDQLIRTRLDSEGQPLERSDEPVAGGQLSPALDENGMPLPEIGKTSGLTDEQWNALIADLGERPGTLDTSKATQLAANTHADTAIDGDVTSGEEPGESTPKTNEAAPATPDPALAAVGNMQSLILAIEHGNDLAATIAAVGLVNNLGQAAGVGNIIPGEIGATLGTIASALNLADALDRGDVGGIVVSGVTLADTVFPGAASKAIAEALGMSAAVDVIPYLGIINGIANGDAVSTLAAAANLIPGYGHVIGIAIVFLGAMFGGDDEPDTPTSYGDASAGWNNAGDIKIAATRDEADGGATATAWMNNLLGGLQEELASRTDASGQPLYGLDPARLPGIGYAFDPDTQAGYLRLSWTEPDGSLQWRQYDTSGRRDGSGEAGTNDLVRDFFLHAADAIVPAWEAQTLFQQGADGQRPAVFTGELSADGATTTRTVLTLGSAATSTNARLDIDGDGYLEATQWTASPMLAIDLDGDGRITAADLVDGREGSQARNGLAALDADGDGIVDARDPAFAALRLWRDTNGDGIAEAGELGSLTEAGVERIDASTLARQTLAGDTRGTAQAMTADGLYQFQEGGETTLLALNQHAFDNDPAHAHGGEANPDAHGEMLVDVGAANMQSTGNARPTTVQTHIQGDAALGDAGPGIVLRGQAPGRTMGDERTLEPLTTATATESEGEGPGARAAAPDAIRIEAGDARVTSNPPNPRPPSPPRTSNPIGPIGPIGPIAFVPGNAASPGRAVREVTRDMIASADSGLFGGGGGAGVAPLAALAVSALPLAFPELAAAAHLEEPSTAPPSRAPASTLTEDRLRSILDASLPASTSPAPHVAGHAAGVEPAPSPSAARLAAPSPMVFANSAPIATGESAATDEDRTILVAPSGLLANDKDIDGADNHKAPAGFPTRPSAYAHRHIACRRARPYNSTLSAKTRDQAGGGQPMTVQRTARARSFQGAMN